MENLGRTLGKYVISILLLIGGVLFLIKYLSGDDIESQPADMLWASLTLILVGVLAAPFILSKFSLQMSRVILAVGLLVTIYLAYRVVFSVEEEIEFRAKKERIDKTVVQRLKDLREAQIAYYENKGKYTADFEELKAFINSATIPQVYKMGRLDTTLEAAIELGFVINKAEVDSVASMLGMSSDEFKKQLETGENGYQILDTTYISFYEKEFAPEVRREKKLPLVSLDSLMFTPSSGLPFKMETSTADIGGVQQPTILVEDPTPFGRPNVKKTALRFGSLTEGHTDGNWKE
ncbi:MAG: phage protease [Flavobacteriales bacterium]|nr:phage protease [Flavobacteriales bacterium]